jgi:cyclophilin family peptidyl-prolyl cis-trans isomerase
MRAALALLGLPLFAAPPTFTVRDAIRAEWMRQPPVFSEAEKAQLPPADRARLELTLKRIGAPGAPALLPAELEKPTLENWEAKAAAAKTPEERFTALYFLNRLKSPKALSALNGLTAKDAEAWPKHLHLEAGIASARLNGCEVGASLQGFLDGLQKAGRIDPVRAQAARLRLVMAGKEKELLPAIPASPGVILSLMDAWIRHPKPANFNWTQGFEELTGLNVSVVPRYFQGTRWPGDPANFEAALIYKGELDKFVCLRFAEAQPRALDTQLAPNFESFWTPKAPAWERFWTLPLLGSFPKSWAEDRATTLLGSYDALGKAQLLPVLRKLGIPLANDCQSQLLAGKNPIARAAAIEDMTEAPADLDTLIARLWKVEEYDGVQILLQSLEKWKLPVERRQAVLKRFFEHPCWTARLDAWRELSKLDSKAPWPAAPKPSATDTAILKEAERLAAAGKPVRLRLTFAGKRKVILRLDPVNAPMNVANLVLLACKGFFNGRLVPRVVPDFVVQMGSPCDTMDGGPGYTVRCENSLTWYGPGSVGMALSGKDTGGSQFFITTNATPHLTGKYTRVGEVEDPDHALPLLDDLELGAKLERAEVLDIRMKR